MPPAATKKELLAAIDKEYRSLRETISDIDESRMVENGVCGVWSAKDIIAHLTEWQRMYFYWYNEGIKGANPPTPAADLKWNQIPELNERIFRKWKNEPLDRVMRDFESTHRQMVELAESLSEEDLFKLDLYPWMRSWTLARWMAANTSSHYLWGRNLIRKWKRSGTK